MSKNFELLHTISNEKELFETLEGWEDLPKTAAEGAGPSPQADAKERGSTPLETGLPDVFQTVRQTLGPLDPFVPDLTRRAKPAEEPIEVKGGGETGDTKFGERFPISRNPITRFNSAPVMSPWADPRIGPEPEPGSDVDSSRSAAIREGIAPRVTGGPLDRREQIEWQGPRERGSGTRPLQKCKTRIDCV